MAFMFVTELSKFVLICERRRSHGRLPFMISQAWYVSESFDESHALFLFGEKQLSCTIHMPTM